MPHLASVVCLVDVLLKYLDLNHLVRLPFPFTLLLRLKKVMVSVHLSMPNTPWIQNMQSVLVSEQTSISFFNQTPANKRSKLSNTSFVQEKWMFSLSTQSQHLAPETKSRVIWVHTMLENKPDLCPKHSETEPQLSQRQKLAEFS